jgi:hypothetical protein
MSILLTIYAGFTHAFESDHIIAVSNMVVKRNKIIKAMKEGMFWGLGHTSTILLIGILFLFLKYKISQNTYKYLEAIVGVMLVFLGLFRLFQWVIKAKTDRHNTKNLNLEIHNQSSKKYVNTYLPVYIVGLIHGLAGSGALLLVIISQTNTIANGLKYIFFFGVGSIFGMIIAASLLNLPLSKKIINHKLLQPLLIFITSFLCIIFGIKIIIDNIF